MSIILHSLCFYESSFKFQLTRVGFIQATHSDNPTVLLNEVIVTSAVKRV